MDVVRTAIERPVTVAVGVILLLLFGLIGLRAIPLQLVPDVDRPVVSVTTTWPGRSPLEVAEDITRPQEERLKNVTNLKAMRSISREGGNLITLELRLDADVSRALQDVADALRQVPGYPEDVDQPVIKDADGAASSAIAWIIVDVDPAAEQAGADFDITTLHDALDAEVKPLLERIDGVAEVNIYGGRERQVHVRVDAEALAARGLTHADVVAALRAENIDSSAGSIAEGKRQWRVRVTGRFASIDAILDTPLAWREGTPVLLRDVGTVEIGHDKVRGFVRSFGRPCIALNVVRQGGANVTEVMTELEQALELVRRDVLPRLDESAGPALRMRQVWDETTYLESAIRLVTNNLWIGGSLAALVLLLFLRSGRPTLIIALSIPVSVIGTFLVLLALGRTLNVVSLAGLAFAVGLVVDNAIVVLENVDRHLRSGLTPAQAAYRGTREVWGAVLASTLTTVAVFVPVLTIREEAGQLFQDISLAVAASVALSLLVSVTVIPAACARWLKPVVPGTAMRRAVGAHLGTAIVARLTSFLRSCLSPARSWTLRPALILGFVAASLLGAKLLAPPLDYLPAGNQNLVFGGLLIPPGLSQEHVVGIAQTIEATVGPYAAARADEAESLRGLAPIFRFDAPASPFEPVPVDAFFIGSFEGGMFVGATSQLPEVVLPVGSLLTGAMMSIPDAFGGARQASIFGMASGGSSTIDIELSAPKLGHVVEAAGALMGAIAGRFGPYSVQPEPSNFNLRQPEWRLAPTTAGRESGVSMAALGVAVRSLVDGSFAGEMPLEGRNVDLVVLPPHGAVEDREALRATALATPTGRVAPLDSLASVTTALAPQEIQRIEELPSVTLHLSPPEGRPLADVMAELREAVIAPARASGAVDPSVLVRLQGTAAKLDEVHASLLGAPAAGEPWAAWRLVLAASGLALAGGLVVLALRGGLRAARLRRRDVAVGAVGMLLLGLLLATPLLGLAVRPELLTARFAWAILVTYLLCCALFEDFLLPIVIMLTVPLALVGGFAGLALVHAASLADPTRAPQQLDVVTMLGFIILVGTVVNAAILLVHQSLHYLRGDDGEGGRSEPLPPIEAVLRAVETRVRPIFMTTITSVLGMLPLVVMPGAGSEMYRGLGSVVIGGLVVATIFTLVLVPLVLTLVLDLRAGFAALVASGPVRPA